MKLQEVEKVDCDSIISDRDIRDKCISHYEVLEKVKNVLLVPETEVATTEMVAEFYEVSVESIQKVYQRNKEELELDGVINKKSNDFLGWTKCPSQKAGSTGMLFKDGTIFRIANAGTKVFPRRAILRVGMLLRDSKVAREVRTQLLNIEEKTSKEVKVADINEEQQLALALGMAMASGNLNAITVATANMMDFKNRHINKLQTDNKALAGEILEWKDRKKLSAGIRMLAAVTGISFSNMWNELYKNLQYKYGICLKRRGNKPFIQWVKESEWKSVITTFCAMCEGYNQSPTEMFQETGAMIKLKEKINR